MSISFNEVILMGVVKGNPHYYTNESGMLAVFIIELPHEWVDRTSGELHKKTETHQVLVFHQGIIEYMKKHLRYGSRVFVKGHLQAKPYTHESGQERSATRVVIGKYDGHLSYLGQAVDYPDESGVHSYDGPSYDEIGI